MSYSKETILFLICVFAGFSLAQQNVKIEGVWEMVSAKWDGKANFVSGRQVKTITKDHFMFIYQDKDTAMSLLNKKTHEDTLLAYAFPLDFGFGTYKLVGNIYTETPELFHQPNYIGLSIDFTMKVEGDSLFQSGKIPLMEGNKKVGESFLEEVYKRIE
jgi:hypothetical protein